MKFASLSATNEPADYDARLVLFVYVGITEPLLERATNQKRLYCSLQGRNHEEHVALFADKFLEVVTKSKSLCIIKNHR
jgi:hypothetical protein